jgi:phage-related protein
VNFVVQHWRWFILALGPVGVAIDVITAHFKFLQSVAVTVFHAVSAAVSATGKVIGTVFSAIVAGVTWLVNTTKHVISTLASILGGPFTWAWDHLIKPVLNLIVSGVRWMVNQVSNLLGKVLGPIKTVGGFFTHVGGGALHAVGSFLGLQSGGTITAPGLAMVGEHGPELLNLPRAAQVIPLTGAAPFNAGGLIGTGGFTIVVPVEIDGREVARATGKYVDNRLARQ